MSTLNGTIEVNGAGAGESSVSKVVSRDGTEIAYWSSGDGPPLVLVHGSTADHTRWATVLPYLEPHVTVHAMDRRGRGGSGDGPDYDLAREYEDVAAVVDAVAEVSGSAVDLLGHSHGGFCAFGAAGLTSNIRKLVLYEGWPAANADAGHGWPPGVEERMNARMAGGKREAALEIFFREVVEMREEEFVTYRALPAWKARVAAAHTIPREMVTPNFDPAQAAKITVPTLMLVGGDSPDSIKLDYELVAASIPNVRVTILEGQQHIAMDIVPEVFTQAVLTFLRG